MRLDEGLKQFIDAVGGSGQTDPEETVAFSPTVLDFEERMKSRNETFHLIPGPAGQPRSRPHAMFMRWGFGEMEWPSHRISGVARATLYQDGMPQLHIGNCPQVRKESEAPLLLASSFGHRRQELSKFPKKNMRKIDPCSVVSQPDQASSSIPFVTSPNPAGIDSFCIEVTPFFPRVILLYPVLPVLLAGARYAGSSSLP